LFLPFVTIPIKHPFSPSGGHISIRRWQQKSLFKQAVHKVDTAE
jgi:hypothetical protein